LPLLPVLNKARMIPGGYTDRKQGGWHFDLGLSQRDKLGDAAEALYRKLLKDLFLERLMSRIEQQLQNNTNNSDYLYEALKVYLMLNDSDHYNANTFSDWVSKDWQHNLPANTSNDQRKALSEHLSTLLETQPTPLPRPLSSHLIQQTRTILAGTPQAERAYARLKLELSDADSSEFTISDNAGRDALLVLASNNGEPLTQSIPSFFTCAGYQDGFLKNHERIISQQAGDQWIIGGEQKTEFSDTELKTLNENVSRLYFEDYIRHWDSLLANIQLKPFTNQEQMVELLGVVTSESSPLRLFLQAVDRETSFACLADKEKSLLGKADKTLNSAKSALDKIMSSTPEAQQAAPPQITTNLVTQHFKDLHDLVQSKDNAGSALDRSLSSLNELYVYLNSLAHASGEELVLEQRKQVVQIIDKVKLEGKRTRFPLLNKMITNVADGSNSLVSNNVQKHLNDRWQAEVVPFCQKAIQGLYPIANNSREITYEDFTYFFGPDGLMDAFFKKYLVASVEKSGSNWHWQSNGEAGSGISPASLKQFQIADTIKNVFFRMGKAPTVSFKLKPLTMSTNIEQFMLDVDGQTLTYAHGPLQPMEMKWPGPNNSGQVRIELLPPLEGNSGLSKEGPWALFRLFEQAKMTKTSNPTVFFVTFNLQGREAKFELNANSAINPFQLADLQAFKCLPNL
jgi:type VI secretion system protein ImpL